MHFHQYYFETSRITRTGNEKICGARAFRYTITPQGQSLLMGGLSLGSLAASFRARGSVHRRISHRHTALSPCCSEATIDLLNCVHAPRLTVVTVCVYLCVHTVGTIIEFTICRIAAFFSLIVVFAQCLLHIHDHGINEPPKLVSLGFRLI